MPGNGGGELQSIRRPSRGSRPPLSRLIAGERDRCWDSWRRIDDLPKNVPIGASRSEQEADQSARHVLPRASLGQEGEPRQRHVRGLRLAIKLERRMVLATRTVSWSPFPG